MSGCEFGRNSVQYSCDFPILPHVTEQTARSTNDFDVFFLSVTAFTSTLLLYVHPAYTRFVFICVIFFCFPFQWSSRRKTAKIDEWVSHTIIET